MAFLDDYEPVEDRLAKFWAEHPDGQILTEIVDSEVGTWIVKASVWRYRWKLIDLDIEKVPTEHVRPDATGLAQEVVTDRGVNSTSALENCETSAIGRALANLGYAAKGKRASREEMAKTQPPPPEDASDWLAVQVTRFALWTPEQQKKAGIAANKIVKPGKPINRQEAQAIIEEMNIAYRTEFPDSDQLPIGE